LAPPAGDRAGCAQFRALDEAPGRAKRGRDRGQSARPLRQAASRRANPGASARAGRAAVMARPLRPDEERLIMRIIHLFVIGILVFAAAYVYRIKMESTSRVERVLRLNAEIREQRDAIAAL